MARPGSGGRRPRVAVTLLAAVALLASSIAFLAASPAAQAAQKQSGRGVSAGAPGLQARGPADQHADAPGKPGDPCKAISATDIGVNSAHVVMWFFAMTTHFCWNGTLYGPWSKFVEVTSRSTKVAAGVTSAGSRAGYRFIRNTGFKSHCFVSGYGFSGGINKCSGNYEYDKVQFRRCVSGRCSNAYPWIEQVEYLNGRYKQVGG
jgi:hypothetical protein